MGGRNADEALSAAAFADDFDLAPAVPRDRRRRERAARVAKASAVLARPERRRDARPYRAVRAPHTLSLREHFTFVVSQRRDDESLTKLIDIAQHDRDVQIRKQAMFWLGQSKDPRATKFFRDVLTP